MPTVIQTPTDESSFQKLAIHARVIASDLEESKLLNEHFKSVNDVFETRIAQLEREAKAATEKFNALQEERNGLWSANKSLALNNQVLTERLKSQSKLL